MTDFGSDIYDAAAARAKPAAGYMRLKVRSAVLDIGKEKEDLDVSPRYAMLVADFSPMKDPTNPDSVLSMSIRNWQCLPYQRAHWAKAFEAGDVEEETYRKWRKNLQGFARGTHEVLSALMGSAEVPTLPYKEGKSWYYQGEEIDKESVQECKAAALRVAGGIAEEACKNGLDEEEGEVSDETVFEFLEDACCYAEVYYEPESDYPDSPRLRNFSFDPPVNRKTGQPIDVLTGDGIIG